MGLDMYLYKVPPGVSVRDITPSDSNEFAYWRKFYELDSWFRENLSKVDGEYDFYNVTATDLDKLENAVDQLYLNLYDDEPRLHASIADAIAQARAVISEGCGVVYESNS